MGYTGYVTKGYNSTREYYHGCCYNTHAEMDAISKLPLLNKNKKNKKKINLIVIRINKSGELKNSKPCCKCIEHLDAIGKKGYVLKNVWYSGDQGNMVKEQFSKLKYKGNHMSSGFVYKLGKN